MPRSPLSLQPRPTEGFYTSELVRPSALPVRTFLPTGYEPNYPYPLVVLFHRAGGNDDQVLRMAPRISRRNYICIALRGPEPAGIRDDGRPGYNWANTDAADEHMQEYLVRAVEQTRRNYHVHSERIYLAGVEEGATQAYRLGLRMPEKLAGIISLNGALPKPVEGSPLFKYPEIRDLRILICHGTMNENASHEDARKDFRLFYSAGCEVAFHSYQTNHKLHPHMLRDANRWIMGNVNAEVDCWLDDEE
jgi:phospholipase/carboxylesterase